MKQPESVIKNKILIALGRSVDGIFWNHPTGTAVPMATIKALKSRFHCYPDVVEALNRVPVIKFGLEGSADIIGVHTVTVTAEMVGQKIGVATAIEVKTDTGRQRPEQKRFEAAFAAAGGIYILARSTDDLEPLL